MVARLSSIIGTSHLKKRKPLNIDNDTVLPAFFSRFSLSFGGVVMPRKPGCLTLYADESKKNREMLSDLLDSMLDGGNVFRSLELISGDLFLEILDLFQGDKIEFPTHEEIERRIEYIHIYNDWKHTQNYKTTAVKFKKSASVVEKIVTAVRTELEDMDSEHV